MPFKKDGTRKKSFKRNPYTNSPVGDISGDKVYGPATAVIAAGKKFIKGSKDLVKGAAKAGKTLRKAVKKSKNITGTGGPFMMKPGSREKNTPGSFREEVAPMYYNKKPMNFNGKDKKQKGDIVPMTNEMKKAAKKGASGNIGLVGGLAGKAVKGASKLISKKFSKADKKLFNPDGSSKTGDLYAGAKSRAAKPKSNFRPIITGNRVYDKKSINKAFESRFGKPKKKKPFIDKAFDAFGNTSIQYKDRLPWK